MTDDEGSIPVSDHLAWLRAARGYLYAANAVVEDKDFDHEMVAPALYLVAHGLELLLKANLIGGGVEIGNVKKYNHRLDDLWKHELNARIVQNIMESSRYTYDLAMEYGKIKENMRFDPYIFIGEKISQLSEIHKGRDLPLRYPMRGAVWVPNSRFLIEVLIPVVTKECGKVGRLPQR